MILSSASALLCLTLFGREALVLKHDLILETQPQCNANAAA